MAEITDAMVADIVMGWRLDGCEWVDSNGAYAAQADDAFIEPMFTPTTDISQAFQIVERMRELGWFFDLGTKGKDPKWYAGFLSGYTGDFKDTTADTPAMAICKAAIEALESQNKAKMSDNGNCGSRISDKA